MVIPKSISPEQALPILNQIIRTSSFPVLWAAVKMQTDVSRPLDDFELFVELRLQS